MIRRRVRLGQREPIFQVPIALDPQKGVVSLGPRPPKFFDLLRSDFFDRLFPACCFFGRFPLDEAQMVAQGGHALLKALLRTLLPRVSLERTELLHQAFETGVHLVGADPVDLPDGIDQLFQLLRRFK